MKSKELLAASLTYLIGVTAVYFIAVHYIEDAVSISRVVGTVLAVLIATWFYQSRNEKLAPPKVKLAVGATLAMLCVLQGVAFQQVLKWETHPNMRILFGALGAILFPFVIWNTFGNTIVALKKR